MESGERTGERKATIPHVAALDGARGAAVAGVLFFHGGHLTGGYLGVDFFFVLSGFLITSLLLAESTRTGVVGLGRFWSRRARRLLPALAVLMVGVALYCVFLAKPEELAQIRGDAIATLLYVANWRAIFSHQDYWAIFSAPSPLNHTWSLAIEEQFYLIWPLVFVGLLARWKRKTPEAVFVTALVLAAVSAVLMFVLYDPLNTNRAYFGTDTRAAAVLLGAALAAWLAMKGPTRDRALLEGVGIAGAIVLALAWTQLDGQSSTLYRGGFLVCGVCATAVIASAVHPRPGVLSRALSFRPLCALGLISYGVYLYHWPLDVVLNEQRVHLSGWPLFAVQTGVTIAVAIVSYRWIEQPIRRGAVSAQEWRKFAPVIAIVLLASIVAVTARARPTAATPTEKRTYAEVRTIQRDDPDARRVVVTGNSIATLIGDPMQSLEPKSALAVVDVGLPACHLLPGITRERNRSSQGGVTVSATYPCASKFDENVARRFRPQVVFWMMSAAPDAFLRNGHWLPTCSAGYAELFRRALTDEIAKLRASGAHVVITTASYPGFPVPHHPIDCDNALRRQVAKTTGAQLVDLFEYECPRGRCRLRQDGVVLRTDGLHYRDAGGRIISRWLLDQIAPSVWKRN